MRWPTRFRMAAALVAVLAVSPEPARAQGAQELVADIQGKDAAARSAAATKLSQIGAPAIAPVCRLLYDPRMKSHGPALLALRQIVWRAARTHADSERKAISAALLAQAASPSVRLDARRAILELASFVAGRESVPALFGLLNEPAVREIALLALARVPGPAAGSAITSALRGADARTQVALIDALAQRRYRPAAPRIRALLRTRDRGVRLAAIEALGALTDMASLPYLLRVAESGHSHERASAMESCLKLAGAALAHGDSRRAIDVYLRIGDSSSTSAERCAAIVGISHVTDPAYDKQVLTTLAGGLKSEDSQLRGLAADRLSRSQSPAATARLIALTGKGSAEQRASATSALAMRSGDEALRAMFVAARSSEPSVRLAALRGILSRQDAPAVQTITMLDKRLPAAASEQERQQVLAGIAKYGDPASLPALKSELTTERPKAPVLSAMLPIADRLAAAKRKDEAIQIYRQAMTQGGSPQTVRGAARSLRALGVEVDVVSDLGFIPEWWVLGPIPGREEWRSKDALAIGAVDTGAAVSVPGGELRWKRVTLDDPTGMIDLNSEIARRDTAAAYAYAEIVSPRDQDAVFRIGSDDDFVCYLNGTKVGLYIGDRAWTADQDSVPVHLAAGWNQIVIKVLNGGGDWAFSLRIVDKNGDPLDLQRSKP